MELFAQCVLGFVVGWFIADFARTLFQLWRDLIMDRRYSDWVDWSVVSALTLIAIVISSFLFYGLVTWIGG